MQFCPNCGNAMNENVVNDSVNNVGQQPVNNVNQSMNEQDKVNVCLVVLSWFIPIAGLIVFFIKKDSSPKTAKASGICALISFVLNILIMVLMFALVIKPVMDANKKIIEQTGSLVEDVYEDVTENVDGVDADEEIDKVRDEYEEVGKEMEDAIDKANGNVSKDWKQYQVSVGGKVLTLPTTYIELSSASGFTFKSADLSGTLEDGYYATVNMYKNGKLALYVEVLNDSGAEAKYINSKVTRISQTKYQISQGAEAIVFPGGIKAGDAITEAQIISLFGTPTETKDYSSDNYSSKKYSYLSDTSWTTTNNFKISVINGVIDDIQLDHRG